MKTPLKLFCGLLALLLSSGVFASESFVHSDASLINLRPVQNAHRNKMDISGIWSFKIDPEDAGESEGWFNALQNAVDIAVPGSWNDQIEGLHNYLGTAWYQTKTFVPATWKGERIFIRIGAATYSTKLWINGKPVGCHEGGNLPFAFEISSFVELGKENTISIEIENKISPVRVPTGNVGSASMMNNVPAVNYDFFPYSGIHRNVELYTVPRAASITDVTCVTSFEGSVGKIGTAVEKSGNATGCRVTIKSEEGETWTSTFKFIGNSAETSIEIPNVHLWDVGSPYLYSVQVELLAGNKTVDSYALHTGVRTVSVTENQILLNGKPVKLKGFGKHEDFMIFGRGVALPVTVRDYELMKWIGANSFRTSHYPYDDNVYDIADRMGFLIIDEIPSVGLVFHDGAENVALRQAQCRLALEEMINRDKNHPSIIMWSVANEPTYQWILPKDGEKSESEIGIESLGELINIAKAKDPTRLATFVHVGGSPDSWLQIADVICINRYSGWYSSLGNLENAHKQISEEIDRLHDKYRKPIFISEFGADTHAGFHSADALAFSEEYQCKMLNVYLDIANTRDFVVGMHIWNFADFQTAQGLTRANSINQKGVFTRDRQPKMAAHLLHMRWTAGDGKY